MNHTRRHFAPAVVGVLALALVLTAGQPASAASMVDRGLGARVADLEAEVRLLKNRVKALEDRKLAVPDKLVVSGNSRVKVTLYGQVNRAVVFGFSRRNTEIHHVDNDSTSSRIGILAEGRLFPDLTVSALTEVEWNNNVRSATDDNSVGNVQVRARKVEIWFTHATLGSLYLGQGDAAAVDAPAITLSGTDIVFTSVGCGDDGLRFYGNTNTFAPNGLAFGDTCANLDSDRQNRIMYVSPKVAGLYVRVSHGENDQFDAALFYEGTPLPDFEVAGAFGYIYAPTNATTLPNAGRAASNSYVGSIGILHTPTGLNINAAAGLQVFPGASAPSVANPSFWYVEGGWQGMIWTMGKSYLSANVGNYDHFTNDAHAWVAGAAFVQEIDAAATDLYVGYRWQDAKLNGTRLDATHVIIAGAHIRF